MCFDDTIRTCTDNEYFFPNTLMSRIKLSNDEQDFKMCMCKEIYELTMIKQKHQYFHNLTIIKQVTNNVTNFNY